MTSLIRNAVKAAQEVRWDTTIALDTAKHALRVVQSGYARSWQFLGNHSLGNIPSSSTMVKARDLGIRDRTNFWSIDLLKTPDFWIGRNLMRPTGRPVLFNQEFFLSWNGPLNPRRFCSNKPPAAEPKVKPTKTNKAKELLAKTQDAFFKRMQNLQFYGKRLFGKARQVRPHQIGLKLREGSWGYVKRLAIPETLLKLMLYTGTAKTFIDNYKELGQLEKKIKKSKNVVRAAVSHMKKLTVIPRMSLYLDPDPEAVRDDIIRIEDLIRSLDEIESHLKRLGSSYWITKKIFSFFGYSTANEKEQISKQAKILSAFLKFSLGVLKGREFYQQAQYEKANEELKNLEGNLETFADTERMNGLGLEDLKNEITLLLCCYYNIYALAQRSVAKIGEKTENLENAQETFLKGLEIIIGEKSSNKFGNRPLKDKIESILIKVEEKKAVLNKNEFLPVFLSNMGFLINQYNDPVLALKCHVLASDFSRSISVLNGLAYGYTRLAISTDDFDKKLEHYKLAENYYNHVMSFDPYNRILIYNKAEMFLEQAEDLNTEVERKKLYFQARSLLEQLIKMLEEKKEAPRTYVFIGYAVCCSNVAQLTNDENLYLIAEEYMKKAENRNMFDPHLGDYFHQVFSNKGAYYLPGFDSNNAPRKNYRNQRAVLSESNL